jgi:hypothetical protein
MPKGEKVLSPKQKDRRHHHFKKFRNKVLIDVFHISIFKGQFLQLVSLKVNFQIDIYFKTLLKAKRRISFTESFYKVKGKAFKIGGEISNLENASCSIIHIPLTICKKF